MATSIKLQNGELSFLNGQATQLTVKVDEINTMSIGNGKIKSTNTIFDNSQLFVTKQYVDNVARGLDVKESCRFATKSNIDLTQNVAANDLNIDMDHQNMNLEDGDRVLVKNQTLSYQNGIYRYNGTTLVRADDFSNTSYVTKGAFTFVFSGGSNSTTINTGFAVSTLGNADGFTLDSTLTDTAGDYRGRIVFTVISSQADNYKDASQINTGKLDSSFLEISPTGGLDSKSDGVGVKAGGIQDNMIAASTITNAKLSTAGRVPFTTNAIDGLASAGVTVTNLTTSDNIVLGETVNFAIGSGDIIDDMIANGVDGAKLSVGSVPNTSLVNDSVTIAVSDGLQTSAGTFALGGSTAISIADLGIVGAKIANATVTNNKLANPQLAITTSVSSGLAGGATAQLGGSFDLSIATGGVDTLKIADNAVTNGKIANPNVSINTTSGLTGGATIDLGGTMSIGIATGGVSNTMLAAGSVSNDKLENSGFTLTAGSGLTGAGGFVLGDVKTISIATLGVTNTHISNVNGNKIDAGSIPNTAMVNDSITITPSLTGGLSVVGSDTNNLNEVSLGTTVTVGIKDGGVENVMIKDSTIQNTKLQNKGFTFTGADGILVNTAQTSIKDLGTTVALSIENGSLVGDKIALSEITNAHLVNSSLTVAPAVGGGLELTGNGVIPLGGSQTIAISNLGVTNAMLAGSIANTKLVNKVITVNAGTGLTGGGVVELGNAITINAAQDISATADVTFASITATSDPRLKANMTVLENCSGMVDKMNGYSFNWKSGNNTEALQYGLNADEVESVNPDLIKMGDNGFKSVNYNSVIAILLGAVKELKEEVAELKAARA